MAHTPALTLPVSLTVGDESFVVGELQLDPGEDVRGALAALFRDAADAFEAEPEGGDDGTS